MNCRVSQPISFDSLFIAGILPKNWNLHDYQKKYLGSKKVKTLNSHRKKVDLLIFLRAVPLSQFDLKQNKITEVEVKHVLTPNSRFLELEVRNES